MHSDYAFGTGPAEMEMQMGGGKQMPCWLLAICGARAGHATLLQTELGARFVEVALRTKKERLAPRITKTR